MTEVTHRDEALRLQSFLSEGLHRLGDLRQIPDCSDHADQVERFLEVTAQALIGHISLIDEDE